MNETIRVRAEHMPARDALDQAVARLGVREIDPAAAVTIAALWQSPGNVGRVLAAFASGCEVDVSELLLDVYRTRQTTVISPRDRTALDMLCTFAMNHSADM